MSFISINTSPTKQTTTKISFIILLNLLARQEPLLFPKLLTSKKQKQMHKKQNVLLTLPKLANIVTILSHKLADIIDASSHDIRSFILVSSTNKSNFFFFFFFLLPMLLFCFPINPERQIPRKKENEKTERFTNLLMNTFDKKTTHIIYILSTELPNL